MAKTVQCPQCGRDVEVKLNRFHDEIYARHNMATAYAPGSTSKLSDETRADLRPGHDRDRLYTFQTVCPMSGQPL